METNIGDHRNIQKLSFFQLDETYLRQEIRKVEGGYISTGRKQRQSQHKINYRSSDLPFINIEQLSYAVQVFYC